jgi:site-specific DNA recombinase
VRDRNGLTNITKALNAEGAPAPRPQQGRPAASAPSSVRAVLMRPLYRGEIVWNRTRKRHTWGRSKRSNRDDTTWLRVPAPTLQIVSDELWHDAQRERLARERPFATGGRCYRPSKYLLSGLARCAECGGGFASDSRQHGGHRALFYACTTHWKRGEQACHNGLVGRMEAIDAEVLATLRHSPAGCHRAGDRAGAEGPDALPAGAGPRRPRAGTHSRPCRVRSAR